MSPKVYTLLVLLWKTPAIAACTELKSTYFIFVHLQVAGLQL